VAVYDNSTPLYEKTRVQWWKTEIYHYRDLIEVGQYQQDTLGAANYCTESLDYSLALENGIIQDPDGTTLIDWLQDEIKHDVACVYPDF